MARNGSGTYTVPNTFASGASITASGHNQNWSDAATELTNSVAADGQTAMTAPLKASNGTVAAPSLTFASDPDTGLYRSGANELSAAVGGTQTLKVSSAGVDAVAGRLLEGGVSLVPAGAVMPYAGSSAPTGWLLCNGAAVSRTTYADLFTAISTTFGTGDGSTTFNLPDCTGRVIAGKEAAATRLTSAVSGVDGATLGSASGSQSHTQSISEMPSHTHTGTTNASTVDGGISTPIYAAGAAVAAFALGGAQTAIPFSSHTHTFTTAATGSGNPFTIVQPTIVLNYIIKH